jgi:hypothetical protein
LFTVLLGVTGVNFDPTAGAGNAGDFGSMSEVESASFWIMDDLFKRLVTAGRIDGIAGGVTASWTNRFPARPALYKLEDVRYADVTGDEIAGAVAAAGIDRLNRLIPPWAKPADAAPLAARSSTPLANRCPVARTGFPLAANCCWCCWRSAYWALVPLERPSPATSLKPARADPSILSPPAWNAAPVWGRPEAVAIVPIALAPAP